MEYVLGIFLIILGVLWFILGTTFASFDFCNKKFTTPRYFYEGGYNWIASWVCFILKSLIALPFYIIGIIVHYVCKFFSWLVRVGRK
jgi:hypothetical protein